MRIGSNPKTGEAIAVKFYGHRVIIPVYIPTLEGYYGEAKEILQLSLDSLLRSIDKEATAVTVIANDCCGEVLGLLQSYYSEGKINQLILNRENIGKVPAVLRVLRHADEEFLTISDHDVFYMPGWERAVNDIFLSFSGVGAVSPMPNPALRNYRASWSWYYGFVKNSLVRIEDFDIEGYRRFRHGIGDMRELIEWEIQPVGIRSAANGIEAVIGAGHFCLTLHREVVPSLGSGQVIEVFKGAEDEAIDMPIEKAGYLRLSTKKAYVQHMGNTVEPWMLKSVDGIESEVDRQQHYSGLIRRVSASSNFRLTSSLIRRIFSSSRLTRFLSRRI